MGHFHLMHKLFPMPQPLKIPDAKATVDKEWDKLKTIPAWQESKVKSKQEVIDEARREAKKVHFATLMDLCHLKTAELEKQNQKTQRTCCTTWRRCER